MRLTSGIGTGRLRGSWADRLEVLIPCAGYAAATLTGASTSSLGVELLREDPAAPLGRQVGAARLIRSDEWLSQTPIELGVLARGTSTHSPLAQSPDLIYQTSDGGPFESVLFADSGLLRLGPWLPDEMLFAAYRALPLLLLLLTLAPLLRRFGATRTMSWLAVALVVLSPATLWWSFMPVRILGFAAAGCYWLVLAADRLGRVEPGTRSARSRVAALGLAGLGGAALARLATYYVPWSIVIGLPLATATGLWLLRPTGRRRAGLASLGVGALCGGVLLAGLWWDNLPALQAELGTLYPGLRRASGDRMDPFLLLGAPGLAEQQTGSTPALLNASEISSSFTLCAVWALAVALGITPRQRPRRAGVPGGPGVVDRSGEDRAEVAVRWALGVPLVVWIAWTTLPWGDIGQRVPVLNLVLPIRATQTMGYLAIMLLSLQLSRLRPGRPAGVIGTLAGLACGALTFVGVHDLRRALPGLGVPTTIGVSLLTGLLVFVVTRWPRGVVPVLAVTMAASAGVYRVNPIIFGLGDLRASQTAQALRGYAATADRDGRPALFASDDPYLSAVLIANGVPALTGYQVTGPVREQWAKLDPTGGYAPVWNRGASYLQMRFNAPAGSAPSMSNPSGDVIAVVLDPCTLPRDFGVTHLLAASPLHTGCVSLDRTLRWRGEPAYVYRFTS